MTLNNNGLEMGGIQDYESVIEQYKEAVKSGNQILQHRIMHNNGYGLADTFVRDYTNATMLVSGLVFSEQFQISNLNENLPSPNRKLDPEERTMILYLVNHATQNQFTYEQLRSHLNEIYKKIRQTIRMAKQKQNEKKLA